MLPLSPWHGGRMVACREISAKQSDDSLSSSKEKMTKDSER